MEYIIRFLVGGIVVSAFSLIGGVFRPRRFSGLFSAAPTVALATLGILFATGGPVKVITEGHSMLFGALALLTYSLVARALMKHFGWSSLKASILAYAAWFCVALGLWFGLLRG